MHALAKVVGTAALLAALPFSVWAQQTASPKHVLMLSWDARDEGGNADFERNFQEALRSATPRDIEYYFEYLESSRFPGENQSEFLRDYMQRKYAGRGIDVVVTNAGPALDFLFKYRDGLFPHTPIVFAANQRPGAAQLKSGAGATGAIFVNSYRKTLDVAMKLHPGTEQVFIVSGTAFSGVDWAAMARNDLQGFNAAAITYLSDLPLDELTARLRSLPRRSIVLYVWQRVRNEQGTLLSSRDVLSLIAPSVRVPIYGMSWANIGRGIVGGYVWTMETHAAKVAELTSEVLEGARAADIPVENTPVVPMFDWRQLQHWGIDENRLPPNSIVDFRDLTLWQQYKWRIIAAIALFGFQALLISALLIERHRARRGAAALVIAQTVLQESEERFRNMADTAPVLIWVAGPDKLYTFFNKGWLDFTGRSMEQELGRGWMERVHPEDLDRCFATYASSFDARVAFQMEYRLRRADGEIRSLLCAGVPRFQRDGVFAGYIGSCLDITDLKRGQERALTGQKLESMGLLASGVAHDFNNLLGAILTSAELALTERSGSSTFREELLRIKAAAVGGAQIVRQLMIFGGKESPAFEPVDCSLVIREMSEVLKVSISKFATLKTEIAENLSFVYGNPAQIRQLVMNLVLNASQAIGERKGEIRITAKMLTGGHSAPEGVVGSLPQAEYLQLEVADTGCGISEETKARIFDPFFTTKATGRGLGLAVVQGLVLAHRGVIKVTSAPGSGTTFQILLPSMAKDQRQQNEPQIPGKAMDETTSGSGTILIIEDEEMLRVSVSKILRKRGFAVIEAEDGDRGLDLFLTNQSQIDVVLLDMTLPGKAGRAVLEELQRIAPGVKVIITSAYGWEHVQNSLDGLRPSAYIQKPYRVAELVNLLKNCSVEAVPVAG